MNMNSQAPIYLDNHATTPVDTRVASVVADYMTRNFGNANSVDHVLGDRAEEAVSDAKAQIAELVGAKSYEVIFTSGSTESINLAIRGYVAASRHSGSISTPVRIGLTAVEHPAVAETCRALADAGASELTVFGVDGEARLDLV